MCRSCIEFQETRTGPYFSPDDQYLLVVDKENTVEYRTVKIGALVDGMRVILSGISADDTVIVNGIQRVRPGLKVNPVSADTKPAVPKDTTTEQ